MEAMNEPAQQCDHLGTITATLTPEAFYPETGDLMVFLENVHCTRCGTQWLSECHTLDRSCETREIPPEPEYHI